MKHVLKCCDSLIALADLYCQTCSSAGPYIRQLLKLTNPPQEERFREATKIARVCGLLYEHAHFVMGVDLLRVIAGLVPVKEPLPMVICLALNIQEILQKLASEDVESNSYCPEIVRIVRQGFRGSFDVDLKNFLSNPTADLALELINRHRIPALALCKDYAISLRETLLVCFPYLTDRATRKELSDFFSAESFDVFIDYFFQKLLEPRIEAEAMKQFVEWAALVARLEMAFINVKTAKGNIRCVYRGPELEDRLASFESRMYAGIAKDAFGLCKSILQFIRFLIISGPWKPRFGLGCC